MDGFLNKLKSLDAYPKVNEDFFQRTLSGGVITIASSLIMIALFLSELSAPPGSQAARGSRWQARSTVKSPLRSLPDSLLLSFAAGLFLTVTKTNELSVDTSRGELLQINVRLHICRPPRGSALVQLQCSKLANLRLRASSVCCSHLAAPLTACCVAQFDITFPALPCEWLSLDAMDISGEMHLDVVRDTSGPLGHPACDLAPYCRDLVGVAAQVGCMAYLRSCFCAGS